MAGESGALVLGRPGRWSAVGLSGALVFGQLGEDLPSGRREHDGWTAEAGIRGRGVGISGGWASGAVVRLRDVVSSDGWASASIIHGRAVGRSDGRAGGGLRSVRQELG